MPKTPRLPSASMATLLFLITAAPALAQLPGQGVGQQSLRAYTHVFIAYAVVLVLVVGYVVWIARRLTDVERRLGE